ncbi:hypothetical protein [Microbispora sp. NPDC049125]|uniref:hypothetical protein n=1 Tax=Microbispora sp. NPDC049125 TaxID=3154929 RepID=UPI003464FFC7
MRHLERTLDSLVDQGPGAAVFATAAWIFIWFPQMAKSDASTSTHLVMFLGVAMIAKFAATSGKQQACQCREAAHKRRKSAGSNTRTE